MNVQPIGHGAGYGGPSAAHGTPRGPQGPRHEDAPLSPDAQPAAAAAGENEKMKGVMRLLLEGHFKGVADVRLRINFFDELAAGPPPDLTPVIEAETADLLAAVNTELGALLTSGELGPEQIVALIGAQSVFGTTVGQLVQEYTEGGNDDIASFLTEIQSAFDVLAESLSPLLAALPAPEPLVEDPVAAPVATLLDDLHAAFSTAFDALQEALSAAGDPLPPLSPPSGNGAAYDKFLAIYNALRGGEEAVLGGDAPVDTVV